MIINTFKSNIVNKEFLTEDIVKISFAASEKFTFLAGQFINVKFETKSETKWRAYSILNPPSHKGTIDLIIKLVEDGFSSEILKKSGLGDVFELKGPLGSFTFDQDSAMPEQIFIGAGTGIVPLHSMLAEYLSKFKDKKFTLFFGSKTQKELILDTKFKVLEKKFPNFKYNPILSRELWNGLKGHVQDHLPKNLSNKTFYICGLGDMVLQTEEILKSNGVLLENIKKERYT